MALKGNYIVRLPPLVMWIIAIVSWLGVHNYAEAEDHCEVHLSSQSARLDTSNVHKCLQGRIEQLRSAKPTLPVVLTALQQSTIDTKSNKLNLNAKSDRKPAVGNVSTQIASPLFIADLVGNWASQIKITKRVIEQPDPTEARFDYGDDGYVILCVVNSPHGVDLKIPTVFFPGSHNTFRESLSIRGTKRDNWLFCAWLNMMALINPDGINHHAWRFMSIGAVQTKDALGTSFDDTIVHRSFAKIGANVYEQDVVVKQMKNGLLSDYKESVVRLTVAGNKISSINILRAKYAPDRTLKTLTVMEGAVTQDWQPTARAISKLTGRQP
jgi:hypothetical protein